MKQKLKDLFRKVCNKLFLMLAQGIIEKKPDGSIHICPDVFLDGKISWPPYSSGGDITPFGKKIEVEKVNMSASSTNERNKL